MKSKFKIPAEKFVVPLVIVLVGFVALFSVLEISLRLIIHRRENRFLASIKETNGAKTPNRAPITILCLGDSYTVGGPGKFEDSYPKILEEKLNHAYACPRRYKVFNGGICEANSTQVLRRLKKIIGLRHIDHVILEVGSANRFNLVGYNLYENKKSGFWEELRVNNMAHILSANIKGLLLRSQSARFFERQPKQAENEELLKQAVDENPTDDTLAANRGRRLMRQQRFEEAESIFRKCIEHAPENYTHYIDLAECYQEHYRYFLLETTFMPGDELLPIQRQPYYVITDDNFAASVPTKIEDLLKKAVNLAPTDKTPRLKLARFYARTSRIKQAKTMLQDIIKKWPDRSHDACNAFHDIAGDWNNWNKASELAARLAICADERSVPLTYEQSQMMLRHDWEQMKRPAQMMRQPLDMLRHNPRNFHVYYFLLKSYELQNKYDARDVRDFLEEIKQQDPSIINNATFMQYCSFFNDRKKWEKKLYQWLEHDLDEIADLCSRAGINLIIQNYPYPYHAVNEILKHASAKRGLLFVDNQSLFDKLTREASQEKYFKDDDHCTALGHAIMADNVIRALKSRNIIVASANQSSARRFSGGTKPPQQKSQKNQRASPQ
jgi:tetratricopeptide (TPR) repeat protein